MTRLVSIFALLLTCLLAPCVARAAVLRSEEGSYGSAESVTLEVGKGPPSTIVARSLLNGQLELQDRSAAIVFDSPDSPVTCRMHGPNRAVCRQPINDPSYYLTIRGGAHNDVIDARGVEAMNVVLEGGGGNDTLLAPRHPPEPSETTIFGGPGRNTIVGGPRATVSYAHARGPVSVDLARGIGVARGEHDRLIEVHHVTGSSDALNLLSSGRVTGSLEGGSAANRILTQSPNMTVRLPQPHAPSTVLCGRPSLVTGLEADDLLGGRCRTRSLALHLPMGSPVSSLLTLYSAPTIERSIVLTAGSVVVGETAASPRARSTPCFLNHVGRGLLRRSGHLRVRVSEYFISPGPHVASQPVAGFSTILRVRA